MNYFVPNKEGILILPLGSVTYLAIIEGLGILLIISL